MKRSHVVLLGAGASRAALPHGDKYGRKLPLMNDLVSTLGLDSLPFAKGLDWSSRNFEEIFSEIHSSGDRSLTSAIEACVFEYFSELRLPNEPTLYDHLVLSLREKDLIATFNWDPLLCYAISRCRHHIPAFREPEFAFLHGCVAVGYCSTDRRWGPRGHVCPRCREPYKNCPILYPISDKSYEGDELIGEYWRRLQNHLKHAYVLTIFGYGAPVSDISAIDLMKRAWGRGESRQFEQIEIIDIRAKDELFEQWRPFMCLGHEDFRTSFYESWITSHPRRSCEAVWAQTMGTAWLGYVPYPQGSTWDELREFYKAKINRENEESTA